MPAGVAPRRETGELARNHVLAQQRDDAADRSRELDRAAPAHALAPRRGGRQGRQDVHEDLARVAALGAHRGVEVPVLAPQVSGVDPVLAREPERGLGRLAVLVERDTLRGPLDVLDAVRRAAGEPARRERDPAGRAEHVDGVRPATVLEQAVLDERRREVRAHRLRGAGQVLRRQLLAEQLEQEVGHVSALRRRSRSTTRGPAARRSGAARTTPCPPPSRTTTR